MGQTSCLALILSTGDRWMLMGHGESHGSDALCLLFASVRPWPMVVSHRTWMHTRSNAPSHTYTPRAPGAINKKMSQDRQTEWEKAVWSDLSLSDELHWQLYSPHLFPLRGIAGPLYCVESPLWQSVSISSCVHCLLPNKKKCLFSSLHGQSVVHPTLEAI